MELIKYQPHNNLDEILHSIEISELYEHDRLMHTFGIIKQGLIEIFGDTQIRIWDPICESYSEDPIKEYLLRRDMFLWGKSRKPISFGNEFINIQDIKSNRGLHYILIYNSFENCFFNDVVIGHFNKKYGKSLGPLYFILFAKTHYGSIEQYGIHQKKTLKQLKQLNISAVSRDRN